MSSSDLDNGQCHIFGLCEDFDDHQRLQQIVVADVLEDLGHVLTTRDLIICRNETSVGPPPW